MSPRHALTASLGIAIAVALLLAPATAEASHNETYYIGESTDFTGNGCQNTDLNDVTSSLKSRLDSDGWSGIRWLNANAWPEDFIEGNFGGIDGSQADSKTLAVYAGHGNRALLQWGFQRNGICTITLDGSARLGTQQGDDASYAMYVTSCTINLDSLSRHFDQAIRQSFGYHNSPSVKDDQPRDFFEETDSLRNTRAWIEEMEDRPGWWTGDNSPIALTFGTSSSHCQDIEDGAKLRAGTWLTNAPEPDSWYCYEMFNHGDSGC